MSNPPKEWKMVSFGDITKFHKQGYYTKEVYSNKGVRLARITDLHGKKVLYANMPYIDIDNNVYEQFKVEENDFLIARSGSIGRYGIAKGIPERTVFASYLIKFQFDDKKVDLDLVGYIFQYSLLSQLDIITQGSSNININAENIKTLEFYLPESKEQKKIAKILSSVDRVIELTETEIEKLKNLKKGMMQDLLTKGIGHTKFKDSPVGKIPESWEVKKLSDLAKVASSSVDKKIKKGEPEVFLCNYMDVYSNDYIDSSIKFMLSSAKDKDIVKFQLLPGDVLITKDSESPDDIGIPAFVDEVFENLVCGYHLYKITPTTGIYGEFLSYYFKSNFLKNYFFKEANGSTRFGLNRDSIIDLLVPIPSKTEQAKIEGSIRACNQKINVSMKKLNKLKNTKKGLMQDLLTGKVRVKL